MKATAIYESVTAAIVAELESGDGPGAWTQSWRGSFGLPTNASTGVAYRGGNVVALWVAALQHGYETPLWATYRQWESLGAQVRKGERATYGIKWIAPKDDDETEPGRKRGMFPSGFAVFNVAQVDGYDVPAAPEVGSVERDATCERFFATVGATIVEGSPAYAPRLDAILLPPIEAFDSAEAFYATAAHEHVHWTGAASRLDRDGIARSTGFGTTEYAFEELVAELGAAFVCAHLGISTTPRPDHAQYLASWLRALRSDPKAIYRAATLAQAAVDYLLGLAGQANQEVPA